MSLAITAAPWTNDNNTNTTRKRIPYSKRTTIRNTSASAAATSAPFAANEDAADLYSPADGNYLNPATPDALARAPPVASAAESSSIRKILNELKKFDGIENTGGGLADFTPPPLPNLNQRKQPMPIMSANGRNNDDDDDDDEIENMVGEGLSTENIPIYKPAPPISKISAANDLGAYSNYHTSYEPARNLSGFGIGTRTLEYPAGAGSDGSDNHTILEKLNYMIRMLEDQHYEKTSNITEEVILYTFLGVFIIFICDTFARAGKYYR